MTEYSSVLVNTFVSDIQNRQDPTANDNKKTTVNRTSFLLWHYNQQTGIEDPRNYIYLVARNQTVNITYVAKTKEPINEEINIVVSW